MKNTVSSVTKILVSAVLALYKGAQAQVFTDDGISDPISLTTGVLQGDTLAPYLFVIVMDNIMRKAITDDSLGFMYKRNGRKQPAKYVTDLDFADDIALVSSTIKNVEIMLTRIEEEALKVDLKINNKKTEYLIVGNDRLERIYIR